MDLSNLKNSIEAIKSKDLNDDTKIEIVDSILGVIDMIAELSTAIENINELNSKLVQSTQVHEKWIKQNHNNIMNNLKLIKKTK